MTSDEVRDTGGCSKREPKLSVKRLQHTINSVVLIVSKTGLVRVYLVLGNIECALANS